MNLTSSLLTLASHNLSSGLQDPQGYSYCHQFYGSFPNRRDCVKAIYLLEKGTEYITYDVHSGIGDHALPLSKSFGTCMVQVDVAGPRLPGTFDFIPGDIRHMAETVVGECVNGPNKIGGFATSDLQTVNGWITVPETSLDQPYPTSTAFLTVTVTSVVPDWLSPGNYDPIVAFHFSQVALLAIERAYTLAHRIELRKRSSRFLRQGERMEPRGSRVPWWENPYLSGEEAHGTSVVDTGNGGTVSLELPKPVASEANTATSRRRRRARGWW